MLTFHGFLEAVSKDIEEKKDALKSFLSDAKKGRVAVNDGQGKWYRELLLKALENEDPDKVLKLIVDGNEQNAKTLKTLNNNANAIAQRERKRTACHLWHCGQGCRDCSKEEIDAFLYTCCNDCSCSCYKNGNCCNCMQPCSYECGKKMITKFWNWLRCHQDEEQSIETHDFNEEEREWIKILSNPLYISLAWFCRICTEPNGNEAGKRKENEEEDLIVAALRDSHLLQTIASNDIHQHKKEYQKRADEIEEFAKAVVEGSTTSKQLRSIMDTQGEGCLKQGKPEKFNQRLSVLKIATDLERKKFVASGKCQTLLNEFIYYGWSVWQNKTRVPKILWSFLCFFLTVLCSPFYIVFRLWKDFCPSGCCDKDVGCCGDFQRLFEHPYNKFVNHTMFYLVFLGFLITASFEKEFATTDTGLTWIEMVILGVVVGLLVQEFLAYWREGCFIYFSKWWNVVDTMIILLFFSSYSIWVIFFAYYSKHWKPEKTPFIIAEVFFSSGIIVAFFHLSHIFQVDSVLGPLQLSLYRMLKDVWKFLLLFFLLYISFATGLTNMYSYYVASQIKLEQRNMTHYEKWHPYADHVNTGIDLFWLLLGVFDEEKLSVEDPAFKAFSLSGHIFLIVYVVCMVIVALNMLIAMMTKSYEDIQASLFTLLGASSTDTMEQDKEQDEEQGDKLLKTDGDEEQENKYSETEEARLTTMKTLVMKFLKKRYRKHPVSVGQRNRAQTILLTVLEEEEEEEEEEGGGGMN
ncbi:short transient receptor potential channel 5-like isoform X1 [Montipora capricornis]|uniref:short transient receptor potential channel 5-like isoform X1 n=1 Tax=Montipora capricornis TaxID=246305 RepID=UPI0035F21B61